jgi:predicted nuclease of predicted toxin-antitoxin system
MLFLIDENLPRSLTQVFLERGHDAVHAVEIGLRGAPDRAIWDRAAAEGRILITRDLDFPLAAVPRPQGLVLLRLPDSFGRKQIRAIMEEFAETEDFETMPGRITVLSPGRVRTRILD